MSTSTKPTEGPLDHEGQAREAMESRVYFCGCDGKQYTAKEYAAWLLVMKANGKANYKAVEITHRGGSGEPRFDKVPKDFPDGWVSGQCRDCGRVISARDDRENQEGYNGCSEDKQCSNTTRPKQTT